MKSKVSADPLKDLIDYHLDTHSDLAVQDIYKLLHQGVCGPGHLLTDAERARSYLLEEWRDVTGNPAEPLIDPVSPNGKIVRVNLRPFKACGGDVMDLWRVFYDSAQKIEPDIEAFVALWQRFYTCCTDGLLPFSAHEVERLRDEAAPLGYPPKHHSTLYRDVNKPRYRVVLAGELAKIDRFLPEGEDG